MVTEVRDGRSAAVVRSDGPGLDAAVRLRRGTFDLDAELRVRPGETVAVVGPNGAGKTTLLQALAGLDRLEAGRVLLDGAPLDEPGAGGFVRPEHRSVGVVFQDYLLFPNLDVLDNVAFGLRARTGLGRRAARRAASDWLARFDLTALARRRPDQLSGGQSQRVALARALAPEPRLLLLDEPLAALDAATRLDVRAELRQVLAELSVPVVVVTHDLVDALTLADRVVVLQDGHVVQAGVPADVARRPRTVYVARLVGLELLTGTAVSGAGGVEQVVRLDGGGELPVRAAGRPPDGPVLVALRPNAVVLAPTDEPPPPDGRVVLRHGQVAGVEPVGESVRVTVGPPPVVRADLTASRFAELSLGRGTNVVLLVDPADLTVYPR